MSDISEEVERLRREVTTLKEEKDFVWTLWKRLQLSSPDLTEAMGLVVQREQRKYEDGRTHLLVQLEEKEAAINSLNETIRLREEDARALRKCKEELLKRTELLENQCADISDKASRLNQRLANKDDDHQRKVVFSYEEERRSLLDTVSCLQRQLTKVREEKTLLRLANVECEEKLKSLEACSNVIDDLKQQLDDANMHINTQQDTIRMLRDRLEETVQLEREIHKNFEEKGGMEKNDVECLSSERQIIITSLSLSERPLSPIEDLNYKVDKLSIHMQQLQECVSSMPRRNRIGLPICRSKSTPPRKMSSPHQVTAAGGNKDELNRKVQFLTQKLQRIENELSEEKRSSCTSNEFLTKANSRVKSLQLTVKQLRKQIEDSKQIESDWRSNVEQIEKEVERCKNEIRNRDHEIQKLKQDSVADANRITNLLEALEKARVEITERKIASDEFNIVEIDRLKDLVHKLEQDKCELNMMLKDAQCRAEEAEKCQIIVGDRSNNCAKTKRVKIAPRVRLVGHKKKIKNMQMILNHFSTKGDGSQILDSKDEEWEDLSSEDEVEETARTTSEKSTGRSSGTSMGTKVAAAAQINICSERSDGLSRRKHACDKYVARLKETRDRSSEKPVESSPCSQCALHKNRISCLKQQLKAISESRDGLKMRMKNYSTKTKSLHADLIQAKARSKRLVDVIKKQNARTHVLVEERNKLLGVQDSSTNHLDYWQDAQMDISDVGTIAENHLAEMSSHISMCHNLQKELSQRDVEIVQLREKLSRLDRELSCKKRIIEDQRNKLACLDGLKERDRVTTDTKERKIKDLEDLNYRQKIQLDSLQMRLNVILDERKRFELDSSSSVMHIDMLEKKLSDMKHAKQLLEMQLSKMDHDSESRMANVITQSSNAVDKASQQVQRLKTKCSKYDTLIINIARLLTEKVREIRRLIEISQGMLKMTDGRKTTNTDMPPLIKGYEFARDKAADILSLSTSDIDSLLNGSTTPTPKSGRFFNQKNNSGVNDMSGFYTQCREMLKKENFDQELQYLFSEMFNEVVEMVTPLSYDSGCVSS